MIYFCQFCDFDADKRPYDDCNAIIHWSEYLSFVEEDRDAIYKELEALKQFIKINRIQEELRNNRLGLK